MRHAVLATACVLLTLLLSPQSLRAQQLVVNDSFDVSQQGRIASAELIEGEMYAASFTIPAALLPAELLGVRVVMVKGDSPNSFYCGRFAIEVWEESMTPPSVPAQCFLINQKPPGNVIYSMSTQFANNPIGFEVQGDSSNFQDLLFSTINSNPSLMVTIPPVILNTSSVRVGLKAIDRQCGFQMGAAFPLMLTDLDGERVYGTNFLYGYPKGICSPPNQFYLWADMGQFLTTTTPGDFVMRLLLRQPGMSGGGDDMGMMSMDMSASDMGSGSDMFVVMDMAPDGTMLDMQVVSDMAQAEDMMQGGMVDQGNSPQDMDNSNSNASPGLSISSISPSSKSFGVGGDVVIVGTGFETGAEVSLDARKIGVIETRAQRITATIPADLAIGSYDVIVSNPSGATAVMTMGFTVSDPAMMQDMGVATDMASGNGGNDGGSVSSPEAGCGCEASRSGAPAPGTLGAVWLFLAGVVGSRRRRARR